MWAVIAIWIVTIISMIEHRPTEMTLAHVFLSVMISAIIIAFQISYNHVETMSKLKNIEERLQK